MYVDPFWCGVASTILAELAAIILCGIYYSWKGKRK